MQAIDAVSILPMCPPSSAWLPNGISFNAGLYIGIMLRAPASAKSFALWSSYKIAPKRRRNTTGTI